jgi:lysophospholipase L1-like esterase
MSLPRVLLLGDSIRLSYCKIVAALLDEQAEIVGPAENGGDSRLTLSRLDNWLDFYRPDVIHWNNGLHDIKRETGQTQRQVEPPEYAANLRSIADRLLAVAPGRVVWAMTTPVVEAWHNPVKGFDRFNADIEAYNRAARTIMAERKILVTDLHALISSDTQRYILSGDGVHLTDAGRCAAALAVMATLRSVLSAICAGTES